MKPNAALVTQPENRREIEIFAARCEARAYLFAIGEYTLQDAVDVLQYDAEASGLVAELGQDAVQAIMSAAFAAVRDDLPTAEPSSSAEGAWNAPGWREAARDYHQARDGRVSIVEPGELPDKWDELSAGALWDELNSPKRHGVASSTLLAAEHLVRLNDPKQLEAWLLRHSPAERAEIVAHFNKRRRS
jgi:hypothetical protein